MTMNAGIFREYDIRGLVELDLTTDVVTDLGRAIGTLFVREGVTTLTVGRDCRLSSDRLRDELIAGLTATGIDVLDIGVVPTPVLYYSVFKWEVPAGVMITGSHNPAEYNGFKISFGKTSLHGERIQALRRLIEAGDFESGEGQVSERETVSHYIEMIVANLHLGPRDVRAVIDAGNGTGGVVMLPILERLGVEAIPLYCDMDGRFPNHHPDPTMPENLEDLIHTVKDEMADVGIAFDGDTDRIGVVDSDGNVLWGDKLLLLFARDILRTEPGATFVGEVKCSQTLYDDIGARGGRAIMWKTGHSLIKQKMLEENAVLGGEMSGHMFFAHRYFGYDDAIYAGCRLIELMSHHESPLSEMLGDVPETYATPEIRLDSTDEGKFEIVAQVKEIFEGDHVVVAVDGVRVLFDGGWGLLRASNTQPVIVLRCEANTPERLDEIKATMENALVEAGGHPLNYNF